jgi:hypothetical protein
MKGVITRKDLLRRPFLVIRNFGIVVFLKALLFKDKPFLALIQKPQGTIPDTLKPYTSTMDVFSYYERRIGEIFLCLAERFKEPKEVNHLYRTMAKQKMGHYALLQFVKSFAARRKIRNEKWQPHLPKIEPLETEIEVREQRVLRDEISLKEATQITEELAFSDLNRAFSDLKDSIYSNRAAAVSRLILPEQQFDKLCRKNIKKLRKLAEESEKPST